MWAEPHDIYFSACVKEPELATFTWCDCDASEPTKWKPAPTILVTTGKGTHAYWVVNQPITVEQAVRWSKLATLANQGDPKVCEPQRNMRLPGSYNAKYKPPRPCKVSFVSDRLSYDPEELEDALIAAVIADVWQDGNRHTMALATAALLSRAGWSRKRTIHVVTCIMEMADDDDTRDRINAVVGTYDRSEAGETVSAAELRDALQAKNYRILLECLGVTARDGDIILEGVKIGKAATIQRDIADMVLEPKDWAALDGTLARWDGSIWRPVHGDMLVSIIFRLLCRLREVKDGIEQEFSPTAALSKAIKDVVVGELMANELLPPEGDYLPVKNGILDLNTLSLEPHGKEHRFRCILPVEYDPEALCPTWEQFLLEAAPGESEFLQEFAGYCLSSGNPWQRMVWVYGPSGTGKSTFLQAISDLFGPACVAVKSEQISDYSIASLAPAMVAVCSELSTRLLRTASLKSLVSGDTIVGRHPYGRPFSISFRGKFIWASNNLPPVDEAEGLWRRIVVVPFNQIPVRIDPLISQKIRAELPGILNWMLRGRIRVEGYMAAGDWPLPQAVIDTVAEYKESADTFASFARDELILDEESVVTARDLYRRYNFWSGDRGYRPEPFGPTFWRSLRNAGLTPVDSPVLLNGRLTRVWRGAKLAPEIFN